LFEHDLRERLWLMSWGNPVPTLHNTVRGVGLCASRGRRWRHAVADGQENAAAGKPSRGM